MFNCVMQLKLSLPPNSQWHSKNTRSWANHIPPSQPFRLFCFLKTPKILQAFQITFLPLHQFILLIIKFNFSSWRSQYPFFPPPKFWFEPTADSGAGVVLFDLSYFAVVYWCAAVGSGCYFDVAFFFVWTVVILEFLDELYTSRFSSGLGRFFREAFCKRWSNQRIRG